MNSSTDNRAKIVLVAFGREQEVAVVIRILIHQDHGLLGLCQYQRGSEITLARQGAKDTAFVLGAVIDIGHAPRRPELLHSSSPSSAGS